MTAYNYLVVYNQYSYDSSLEYGDQVDVCMDYEIFDTIQEVEVSLYANIFDLISSYGPSKYPLSLHEVTQSSKGWSKFRMAQGLYKIVTTDENDSTLSQYIKSRQSSIYSELVLKAQEDAAVKQAEDLREYATYLQLKKKYEKT